MDAEVLRKIPHRPPFLFVDRVVSRGENTLVAERTWGEDCDFFKGHYPNNPLTPGVLLCESVFQTAGILLADKIPENSNAVPVLARIHGARFKNAVRPNARCTMEVSLVETHGIFSTLHGVVRDGEKLCLSIDFTVAMTTV